MNSTLEYKGYAGTIEFSHEDAIFFGKVIDIDSLISYEGKTVQELELDFQGSVDDYLVLCAEKKIVPEKYYKENINIKIHSPLYNQLTTMAVKSGKSVNFLVEEAIVNYTKNAKHV